MTYDNKAYEEWAKKDLDPAMVEWIIRTALVQIKEAGWRIVKLKNTNEEAGNTSYYIEEEL